MLAKTYSATLDGIEGKLVTIEAAKEKSLPRILITGLPGDIVKESSERVRACLSGLGFDIPRGRILVHLSPADAKKQGSHFDLAIALCVLAAEEFINPSVLNKMAFLAELSLDGKLQPVFGAVPLVDAIEKCDGIDTLVVAAGNNAEAQLMGGKKTRVASTIVEVIEHIAGRSILPLPTPAPRIETVTEKNSTIDDLIGQPLAKRALQISLAGRHHLLLAGPPGMGKSMLAECSKSLLPELSAEQQLRVLKNYCHHRRENITSAPFRSPHHSISAAGLLGGGSGTVIPGEVTLAHLGVLFLDEFPEFRKNVIEGLREPMQTGEIHLHRIGKAIVLPARFTLIAAMNPCPCGYAWAKTHRCRCSNEAIRAYRHKISGAILDRIDLILNLSPSSLRAGSDGQTHRDTKAQIEAAAAIQCERYGAELLNGDVSQTFKSEVETLLPEEKAWITKKVEETNVSFRSTGKILRIARTIADLDGKPEIRMPHLLEALSLRPLRSNLWE